MYQFDGEEHERFEGMLYGNLYDIFKTAMTNSIDLYHLWIYLNIK